MINILFFKFSSRGTQGNNCSILTNIFLTFDALGCTQELIASLYLLISNWSTGSSINNVF